MRTLLQAISLLTLAACSQGPAYQVQTLPSGKPIRVLGVTRINFSGGESALALKYETDVPVSNIPALQKEADEIWQSFRPDVENARLSNALLSATTPAKGLIIKQSKSHTFVYTRDGGGQWARTEK